ncbi:hypothetical protein C2G38_2205186 [Gigaspora rosea]|uniref:Uncharacterized protein n=1 Tax=Gigaspora rosea TaxID=44941 RepID=A0A397UNI6_9GLOM|nr:hypothetical protein C2G38_2205186 [Gigaspora rosea]
MDPLSFYRVNVDIKTLKRMVQYCSTEWIFLKTGEAKTSIDSHHAQISQAIKRYVKLGFSLDSGNDIENAIKDIAGTYVSNITPDRPDRTIAGISNLQEWTWPTDNEKIGFIATRVLSEIGNWKEYNIFTSGWALKENERKAKRQPTIRMTTRIKKLLEIMFHTGTANPSQKLMASQMREELIRHAQAGKIENDKIPKEAMIQNWIGRFSRR